MQPLLPQTQRPTNNQNMPPRPCVGPSHFPGAITMNANKNYNNKVQFFARMAGRMCCGLKRSHSLSHFFPFYALVLSSLIITRFVWLFVFSGVAFLLFTFGEKILILLRVLFFFSWVTFSPFQIWLMVDTIVVALLVHGRHHACVVVVVPLNNGDWYQ